MAREMGEGITGWRGTRDKGVVSLKGRAGGGCTSCAPVRARAPAALPCPANPGSNRNTSGDPGAGRLARSIFTPPSRLLHPRGLAQATLRICAPYISSVDVGTSGSSLGRGAPPARPPARPPTASPRHIYISAIGSMYAAAAQERLNHSKHGPRSRALSDSAASFHVP